YWGSDRFYHHTAPISMNYALREALALVVEEGLEARHARHLRNHKALKAGLTAMGLSYVTAEGHQLPQHNCVRIPDGIDDLAVRHPQILTRDRGECERESRVALEESNQIGMTSGSPACRRGYVGTWEIRDGQLSLLGLRGWYQVLGEGRVPAEWFSGILAIP